MNTKRTAEEAKQNYIEAMGEPLGSLFHELWQEVAWLHKNWKEYVELYGTKPSRIDLLNTAAPTFFRLVQDSLWEGTLLHLARLTDSPRSAGNPNLTIRRLPYLIDDLGVKASVSSLVADAIQATEFCRDWRNRHIAHRDLDLALETSAQPLKPASRKDVKDALTSIVNVLNQVTGHYMDSEAIYSKTSSPYGALSLIYILDDGIKAEEERQERIKRGKHEPEDIQARDL